MRDLIKRLQPDRFDDLTAIVALFRPGPMQMADEFIARKHRAGATPDYLHPRLETTLKPTYGVILYQEQVMQIAQILAGYSLGGADLLRRAMGKKKPEEMAEQRGVFLKGATERGVEAGARQPHLRSDGDVRRLRLQQVARRGLRVDRVSDGLAQDALSRGLHGRRADGGPRQHRSARRAQGRADKHMGIVLEPPDVNRSVLRVHRGRPEAHQLRVGRAEGRRAERRRGDRRPSATRAAPTRASSIFAGAWISRRSIGACSRRSRGPARSTRSARIARR